jgi:2-polyprenyl-6-methoxyphenol hydroxylase-like FAD-dependent oxidoreductase
MNNSIKIGIVGAGIQGVSNALFLQKKGFDVTLLIEMSPEVQQPHMEMRDIFLLMLLYL